VDEDVVGRRRIGRGPVALRPGRPGLHQPGAAARREHQRRVVFAAEVSTALVCCSWGAVCELVQLFIAGREFHWLELGLNVTTPLVVALVSAGVTWLKLSWER
jgi:hypothetical protein